MHPLNNIATLLIAFGTENATEQAWSSLRSAVVGTAEYFNRMKIDWVKDKPEYSGWDKENLPLYLNG